MLKKFGAILLVFIILTVSSISAYAGQTNGNSSTTQTAIAGNDDQQSVTGGTKGSSSTKSSISTEDSNTSESAVSTRNTSVKKPDFSEALDKIMESGKARDDKQFIMSITSPDKDKDSTYSQSYILSGDSSYDDVMIAIAKYNPETKKYEKMMNTEDESSWSIGDFGAFVKSISLDMGVNKIMIMSYRTSRKAIVENVQVNCFTIERLNKSIAERAIKKVTEITKNISDEIENNLKAIFGDKSKQ